MYRTFLQSKFDAIEFYCQLVKSDESNYLLLESSNDFYSKYGWLVMRPL